VWTDEAHRSVFGTWGQVLDYFDAPIVGLTTTPTREVAAYFDGNIVMEVGVQEPVQQSVLRLDDNALRDLWTRAEVTAQIEPRELAMVRLFREVELSLSWRELAVLLERASPYGLSAPAQFLLDFLIDYLRDRKAEQLVDPAATSPPLLAALLEADAAKQAVGFTPSTDVLHLAEALKGDERLSWRQDDLSRPSRPIELGRPDLVVSLPPLRSGRQHATVRLSDGRTVEVRDESAHLIVLRAGTALAEDGEAIFLVTDAFFRQQAGRVRDALGVFGLHVHAVVSVREGFKNTTVPLNLVFIRRTPVDRVFVAQLSPQIDRAQLVSQLQRRIRGQVPELGRLVEWQTFRSFAQITSEERVEALVAETGLRAVLLTDVLTEAVQSPPRDGSDFHPKPNALYLPTFANSPTYSSRDELTSKPKGYYQLVLDPARALAPYVAMLLNSGLGRELRNSVASGTVLPNVSLRAVERLQLPLPPIAVQQKVVEAMSLIQAQRLELDALDRQLTNQPQDVDHVLRNLRELGEHDPLQAFIENLPFPLATILWRYEADAEEKSQVDHLLRFFQASAAFVTVVLLSAFHSDEALFNAEKRDWFRHVRGNLRKTTFGSWTKLGATMAASVRRLLNGSSAEKARILRAFAIDEAFTETVVEESLWGILDDAREIRNQEAHSGIVGPEDVRGWHAELGQLLSKFRRVIAPGLEKVRLIRPGRSENIRGIRRYDKISVLQGPNGIFRQATLEALFEMEGGDALYLITSGLSPLRSALRLLPLLQLRPLPQRAEHAFYFYNASVGDDIEFVSYHFEAESRVNMVDPEVVQLIDELKEPRGIG
jgi:hypothetical protein